MVVTIIVTIPQSRDLVGPGLDLDWDLLSLTIPDLRREPIKTPYLHTAQERREEVSGQQRGEQVL